MMKQRTKQQGATTAVTTLDWQTTGQTRKALNPSECSEVVHPRVQDGSLPHGPTAGCGKPHVRWCGRVPGCNPRHPTRSKELLSFAPLEQRGGPASLNRCVGGGSASRRTGPLGSFDSSPEALTPG